MDIYTSKEKINDNTNKHNKINNIEEDIVLNGMFGNNPFKNQQPKKRENIDLLKWLSKMPVILICCFIILLK